MINLHRLSYASAFYSTILLYANSF